MSASSIELIAISKDNTIQLIFTNKTNINKRAFTNKDKATRSNDSSNSEFNIMNFRFVKISSGSQSKIAKIKSLVYP